MRALQRIFLATAKSDEAQAGEQLTIGNPRMNQARFQTASSKLIVTRPHPQHDFKRPVLYTHTPNGVPPAQAPLLSLANLRSSVYNSVAAVVF